MPVAQIIAYIEFKKLDINEIGFQDLEVIYPKANQLSRENEDFYDVAKGIAKNLNSGNKDYLKQWEKYTTLLFQILKDYLRNSVIILIGIMEKAVLLKKQIWLFQKL